MLEPISKVCLEKLSQTRCASKINRDDLRDVRKAFRTILQIQGGGFDVTAHYSQDLPEGEYAIKQPTACGPVAATVRVVVSSMHANLLMVSRHLIVVKASLHDHLSAEHRNYCKIE
ncbi:TPA: hypothetical protein ACH3X3_012183 [Trebouxia sp. C0006]